MTLFLGHPVCLSVFVRAGLVRKTVEPDKILRGVESQAGSVADQIQDHDD